DRSAEARLPNLRGDRTWALRRRPPLRDPPSICRALLRLLLRRQVHRQVRRLRRRPRLPMPPHGAQGPVPPLPAPEPPPHPRYLRGLIPPPPRPRPLRLPRPLPRRRLLRPPPGARGRPDPLPADARRRPLPPPRRRPPGHQARQHTLRLPGAAEARRLRLRGGDRGRVDGGAEGGRGDAVLRGAGGGGGEGVRGEGGRVECRGGAVRDAGGVPAVLRRERGGDLRGGAEGEPQVPAAGLPVGVGDGEGAAQEDAVQGCVQKILCRSSAQASVGEQLWSSRSGRSTNLT
ncbi:Protein kinase domain-containing protein, partial [Psidium guajava]